MFRYGRHERGESPIRAAIAEDASRTEVYEKLTRAVMLPGMSGCSDKRTCACAGESGSPKVRPAVGSKAALGNSDS